MSVKEARRAWLKAKSNFSVLRRTRSAVLGDGHGTADINIEVPNAPDYAWARDTAESKIYYPILNRVGVPLVHDMPVLLGYTDEEPNIEQVLRIYSEGLGGNTPVTSVPTTAAHHQQHEFGGGDEVDIDSRLFQPGLIKPTTTPSMQVIIEPFIYHYNGYGKFDGATSDSLTQFKPATGNKVYVLIAFDPVIKSIVYRPGLPYVVGSAQDLYPTFEDVPSPSGNEYPLGWIFLEATTTSVDWTTTSNNIGDGRLHVGLPVKNILDRLSQLEGLSGNDPSVALTGAALNTASDYQNRIGNLLDVAVSGATDSQALVFELATRRWIPGVAIGSGATLDPATPANISASGITGISASATRGDHVHKGVFSLVAGTGASVETSPLGTVTVGMAGSGWASAVPSRAFDVVYTNGSLTRMVAISVGLKPSVTVPAEVSLRADAASPPTTEVVRLAGASGLGASVTGEATALIMPNERYWLKNNTGVGGLAEITKWIEYNDFGGAPAPTIVSRVFNGRLSADGDAAVTTTAKVGISAIWYVPYNGNQISLYTPASVWDTVTFNAASLALTGLSPNTNYDVWGYKNVSELSLLTSKWNPNGASRVMGLSAQDGTQSEASNRTRALLGTIRLTGTSAQTEDGLNRRYVWNNYNRVQREMYVVNFSGHTYGTTSWRNYNNSTASAQLEFVLGLLEDTAVPMAILIPITGGSSTANTGIGVDNNTPGFYRTSTAVATATRIPALTLAPQFTQPGYHTATGMEFGATNACFNFLFFEGNIRA